MAAQSNPSSFFKNLFSERIETPAVLSRNIFPSLDGLRALSVLLVILTHTDIFNTRKLGVEVFFVISGFLITTLLLKERILNGSISLRNFYFRRIFRIIPVAFLYIAVIFVLNACGVISPVISPIYFLFAAFSLSNLFNNTWYFTHYWSLSTEEQFYLVFPPVLKKGIRAFLYFSLVLFFVIMLASILQKYISKSTFPNRADIRHYLPYFFNAVKYFEGILVGSWFSILMFKGFFGQKPGRVLKIILDLGLVPMVYVVWKFNYLGGLFNHTLLLVLIAFFIINNLHPSNDPVFWLLNCKPLRVVGLMSYSIYVWQQPFTKHIPWQGVFKGSGGLWFNMTALMLVAWLSWFFWEKYFLKIKDKWYSFKG